MTWNEFSQSFKLFFKAVDSGYMIKRWNKIEIWSIVSAMNVQCMIYSTITLGPRQKGYWEERICPYKISVYEHRSQTHKYVNTNANHRHSYTHPLTAWQSFLTMLNFALLNMAQDGSRIYMASVHFLDGWTLHTMRTFSRRVPRSLSHTVAQDWWPVLWFREGVLHKLLAWLVQWAAPLWPARHSGNYTPPGRVLGSIMLRIFWPDDFD